MRNVLIRRLESRRGKRDNTAFKSQNTKKQCKIKRLKEATVNWLSFWYVSGLFYDLQDAPVFNPARFGGNGSRKRHEKRLIFKIGTIHPHGLNERFSFIWSYPFLVSVFV